MLAGGADHKRLENKSVKKYKLHFFIMGNSMTNLLSLYCTVV
ncbi:hypothetical protein BAZMOX_111148_1 [methanotrophic endosymbiont of Bathymodiolus azoricus (Menez Gwen)]|nr:hypothetical protein BAZMOX_111148_1 [methanotrophic endosymbiont of Bathymodiolus azoricus (Menez Gwen)]